MSGAITTISLPLPFGRRGVNCYLLRAADGFVLVDTGHASARQALLRALGDAGCRPGLLRLVLLTHGDFDHIGNAAALRSAFGAPLAMHSEDAGMAERGDMFAGRRRPRALVRALVPLLVRLRPADRFSPDALLEGGEGLAVHGLEANVVWLPGHSRGSIGLLTAGGALFCGDLLENTAAPALNSLIDDPEAARASLERLRGLEVSTVYPGHGEPFRLEELA
ncbi:MAG TPA: MBL fold metallo-hydrolase [Anaerolineae bacterium]|nr:MBL fold metallo-hydrolase [Anaerolineae bacterium]